MGYNLDDYEPVEERIKRFYNDHESGRILTEMVSDPSNIETVVFKAYVYLDNTEIPVSSGYAYEKYGVGFVNKTSHIENCETSAIGRALANYKYSGDKRPSREEMEKVERMNTQPKQKEPELDKLISQGKELKDLSHEYYEKYKRLYSQQKYKECQDLFDQFMGVKNDNS